MLQSCPMYAYLPAKDVPRARSFYDLPGMTFRDGIHEGVGGKAAWFKDTEGNILALIQDGK